MNDQQPASLGARLDEHRHAILAAWRSAIARASPPQTARLLAGHHDEFRNPLAQRLETTTALVLDLVIDWPADAPLAAALDPLVRVHAVQDRRPSSSLGFVFLLKRAAREVLADTAPEALEVFDARVDALALAAFDAFAACRDELHEIRLRDMRRRVAAVLRRLGDDEDGQGERPRAGEDLDVHRAGSAE